MAVESIAAGVYQIKARFVNAFIVDGDEGVTLVDTLLSNNADTITEGLKEIGRSVGDVRAVLITHSHADHSGGAAAVMAHTDALLYAGEADAPAIQGAEKPPAPPTPFYIKPLT